MTRWRIAVPFAVCALTVLTVGAAPSPGRDAGTGPGPDRTSGTTAVLRAARAPDAADVRFTTASVACHPPAAARTGRAGQVVLVASRGTRARLTGCTRRADGSYLRTFAPVEAWVGHHGVAPAGRKREGDGRTPAGVFRLGAGFGTTAAPGVRFSWLRTDARDVWVDDPRSPLYNTHQRTPVRGRWRSAEKMRIAPYRYAQVVHYNTDRRPGRGSAIFLHVGTRPTAGCVALPAADLVRLLRWQAGPTVLVVS
jgi:L,D-peptidoglycan transpeptidase YkuD (ErfK/YbiS/YcfS/YnhG family)